MIELRAERSAQSSDSAAANTALPPLVYVCVLNWNAHEETLQCVEALARSNYENARIVVADNGSAEESVRALKESGLPFEWILNPVNLGFTGGSNLVLSYALECGADFVWLVNSDALVEPDTLSKLIAAAAAEPAAGILSPVLYVNSHAREIQSCGTRLDVRDGVRDYFEEVPAAIDCMRHAPRQFCVWGTAMLIRRDVIERIGMLDERFFAYDEDFDYCLRAIDAGFEVRLVPDAGVLHGSPAEEPGAESRRLHRNFYVARNRILLSSKHTAGLKRWLCVGRTVVQELRRIDAKQLDGESADLVLDGIWCAFMRRTGCWTRNDSRLQAPGPVRIVLRAMLGLVDLLRPPKVLDSGHATGSARSVSDGLS